MSNLRVRGTDGGGAPIPPRGTRPIRRILYIGNFVADYLTEVHLAASFEEIGIEVVRIGEKNCTEEKVKAAAVGCDLLVYQRTFGMPFDFTKLGIPSVAYTLDLYFGLRRQLGMAHNPFWKADYVITVDGGHDALFRARGIKHHFLPAAVYGKECVPGKFRKEFECDVAFVGTYHYLKDWPYRRKLVDWLKATYGNRFKLFGDVIDNVDPGYPIMVYGSTMADVFASAKIVVCDSINSPFYWSNRIYETLGRGGFAIHPKIEGLDKEFEYGRHVVPYAYGDFADLKRKIDYYLDRDVEREKIRRAGHDFVKDKKTFVQRAQQILKIVYGEKVDPFRT